MTSFSVDFRRLVAEAVLPPRNEVSCPSCFGDPRPGDAYWPRDAGAGQRAIALAVAARVSYASYVVDADLGVLLPWMLRLRAHVDVHESTRTIGVSVVVDDDRVYQLVDWVPVWPFDALNRLCRDVALDLVPGGEVRALCAAVIDRRFSLETFHVCGRGRHPAVVRVVDAFQGVRRSAPDH